MITKEFYRDRQAKRRAEWKAAGKCIDCGAELDIESRRHCAKHGKVRTINQKRRFDKRIQEGICVKCGKYPLVVGLTKCASCLKKRREDLVKTEGTRLWREKVKAECFTAYGGKCVCCGETEPLFLEIDHINSDGSKQRKEVKGGTPMYRWLQKKNYPQDGYRLLCRNCNYGRHRNTKNKGVCPHKVAKGEHKE